MTGTVPEELRGAWQGILDRESELIQALDAGDGDGAVLQNMAEERQQSIERFFAQLPLQAKTAELRLSLLQQLLERNQRLLLLSRDQLDITAGASATVRLNRSAINAYEGQKTPSAGN